MSLVLGIILLFLFIFPILSSACVQEAKDYYASYGIDLDIKGCENKYTGTNPGNHKYAITYVTKGGEVMNIYLDELPSNFNLWNTDVVVTEGRVVVTGVNGDSENTWNIIFAEYREFIVGVSGLAALSCLLAFVVVFIKMGSISNNPNERSKFMSVLLFTGFGAVGLGGMSIIFAFFWNLI